MKKLLFKLALKFIRKTITTGYNHRLTPQYLTDNGWITENDGIRVYFVEPNVKERDRVSITFESNFYRVWHGRDRTFIALETSIEWLKVYMLLLTNGEPVKLNP